MSADTARARPASDWIADAPYREAKMYIGGRWVEAERGVRIDVVDPGIGTVFASVPAASKEDVDVAVAAARSAFDGGEWSGLGTRERSRLLLQMSEALRRDRDTIAEIEVRDNGKLLSAAQWDVDEAAFLFEYYGGWVTKVMGDIPPVGTDAMSLVVNGPVGVAALITPWNFPILMAAQKVAPALAAGCACVLKPAEQTPLTALELARVAEEVGLPAGALNVITGYGPEAGAPLVAHPGVDKVSFTGSLEVGRSVGRTAADAMKRVTLELGGKNPSVVFADADFEAAIDGICKAVFFNQGQVCGSCSRVFLDATIHDETLTAIQSRIEALRPGYGLDPSATMGPLVSAEHLDRVSGYVRAGVEDGAKLSLEGVMPEDDRLARGYFVKPVVFADVDMSMRIAQEEIFGPVMALLRFNEIDDVIAGANATVYGLTASVWTTDLRKGLRIANSLRAGTVWVNDALQAPSEAIWGGVKNSGVGRELGPWGLDQYLEKKQIYVNLKDG